VQHQRLILFCPELELDLEPIRVALSQLAKEDGLEGVELEQIQPSESDLDASWTALVVRPMRGRRTPLDLGERLETVVKRLAEGIGDAVLGVYVHPTGDQARVAFRRPSGFPRTVDGELAQVIRQGAAWIDSTPEGLLRFVEEQAQADAERQVEELDEDDRFVEAKLEEGRRYLEEYRSRRK
jgi:hypothetical protein